MTITCMIWPSFFWKMKTFSKKRKAFSILPIKFITGCPQRPAKTMRQASVIFLQIPVWSPRKVNWEWEKKNTIFRLLLYFNFNWQPAELNTAKSFFLFSWQIWQILTRGVKKKEGLWKWDIVYDWVFGSLATEESHIYGDSHVRICTKRLKEALSRNKLLAQQQQAIADLLVAHKWLLFFFLGVGLGGPLEQVLHKVSAASALG